MSELYGMTNIKIERFKDKYKNQKRFSESFLIYYNCFEKIETFNNCFNFFILSFGYVLVLYNVIVFGGLGEFFLLCSLFIVLIYLIKSVVYLKIKENKINDIYRNGYFIKGLGIKDDIYCNIEHISLHMENLHLELLDKLEKAFNYKIIDDTIYNLKDLQKSNKKSWKFWKK